MSNKLMIFLKNENTRIIASKMPSLKNGVINTQYASDFDVFNALCEDFYLLVGHPTRDMLLRLLTEYSASDISPIMLYDVEYRKKLWQKIFIDDAIALPQAQVNFYYKIKSYTIEKDNIFSINCAIDLSCESIYDLLNRCLEKIKNNSLTIASLDARKIKYLRPDDFHAQKNYEGLKNGEEDSSLLLLWLSCRVLMNTDMQLSLIVDDIKSAEDILILIYRLGLSPDIRLCIDISKFQDFSGIYNLLMQYCKKNISLELFGAKENIDMLIKIFKEIPLAFIEKIDMELIEANTLLSRLLSRDEVKLITY